MKLRNEFTVAVPAERVWETLLDVERVATYLPGARVEAAEEKDTYNGAMRVKVGPMTVNYTGTAKLSSVDDTAKVADIEVQAREAKGQGTAAAVIRNQLQSENGSTRVIVETDLQITGRQAQFGRGIMEDVAGRMFDDFARRFEADLVGGAEEERPEGAPAAGAAEEEALDLGSVLAGSDTMRYGALAGGALLLLLVAWLGLRRGGSRSGIEVRFDRSW